MFRSLVLLAALAALGPLPARAQGPLEPAGGHLPPPNPPAPEEPGHPPRKATPAEPAATLPRGAVLEQISGVVREIDHRTHRLTVESPSGESVTLAIDRNTMVYTAAGLGTVLDVTPGASIRAGRNAELVAYWVQLRPPAAKGATRSPAATQSPAAVTTTTPAGQGASAAP